MKKAARLFGLLFVLNLFFVSCETTDITEEFEIYETDKGDITPVGGEDDEEEDTND